MGSQHSLNDRSPFMTAIVPTPSRTALLPGSVCAGIISIDAPLPDLLITAVDENATVIVECLVIHNTGSSRTGLRIARGASPVDAGEGPRRRRSVDCQLKQVDQLIHYTNTRRMKQSVSTGQTRVFGSEPSRSVSCKRLTDRQQPANPLGCYSAWCCVEWASSSSATSSKRPRCCM